MSRSNSQSRKNRAVLYRGQQKNKHQKKLDKHLMNKVREVMICVLSVCNDRADTGCSQRYLVTKVWEHISDGHEVPNLSSSLIETVLDELIHDNTVVGLYSASTGLTMYWLVENLDERGATA